MKCPAESKQRELSSRVKIELRITARMLFWGYNWINDNEAGQTDRASAETLGHMVTCKIVQDCEVGDIALETNFVCKELGLYKADTKASEDKFYRKLKKLVKRLQRLHE